MPAYKIYIVCLVRKKQINTDCAHFMERWVTFRVNKYEVVKGISKGLAVPGIMYRAGIGGNAELNWKFVNKKDRRNGSN